MFAQEKRNTHPEIVPLSGRSRGAIVLFWRKTYSGVSRKSTHKIDCNPEGVSSLLKK